MSKADEVAVLRAIKILIETLPDDVKVYLLREFMTYGKRRPDWPGTIEFAVDQTRLWRQISGAVVHLPKSLDNTY